MKSDLRQTPGYCRPALGVDLLKKKKFIIGGAVLLLVIGFLAYRGFAGSAAYYYTVGELLSQGNALSGKVLRVNGQVLAGSVEQKPGNLDLKFTVTQSGQNLPVTYRGVVPDTFKPGGDIVVEGSLAPDGTFVAKTLMPKCPSKYLPVG